MRHLNCFAKAIFSSIRTLFSFYYTDMFVCMGQSDETFTDMPALHLEDRDQCLESLSLSNLEEDLPFNTGTNLLS